MTEILLDRDDLDPDEVATELRALAERAQPSVRARSDLAVMVVRRYRRRARLRLAGAGVAGLVVVGAVAAGALTGHHGYLAITQPSLGMVPTVPEGQTVVLSKTLKPERGDVVLAHRTEDGATFQVLQRVIGLPGDTVGCPAASSGRCEAVVVNGRPMTELYLKGRVTDPFATVTVPAGEVFLLGDNRPLSNDSRYLGPVDLKQVIGVAVRIENSAGMARPVPGAPEHKGPPDDGVQDIPGPVPPGIAVSPR